LQVYVYLFLLKWPSGNKNYIHFFSNSPEIAAASGVRKI